MNATQKKVMILDDDPDIVLVLAAMLEDAGYAVVTADQCDELIDGFYTQELPDVILLDMLLSGSDGREIARQLKRQKLTRGIPVLMLSAHPNAEQEAKAAGADDFLAKPFEIEELLNKVAAYLA